MTECERIIKEGILPKSFFQRKYNVIFMLVKREKNYGLFPWICF